MNGWSCCFKNGPAHFTVLKTLLIWMVWSFSNTFEPMVRPGSPKHGPVPFTVLKNLFVWMLCSQINIFQFMAGPRSPTSPVTAQLTSRRWRIISFWCCADNQQRSNERMVVLPQTRSNAFHSVEDSSHLDGNFFFQKHSNSWLGRASPNTAQFLSRCWWTFFVWMLCSQLNTFKFMAGPRSPTSPVTAQLTSRRWGIVLFCSFADFQQRSNERLVVLSQTRWNAFHGFEDSSYLDGMKLFKNIQTYGWMVFP